MPIRFFCEHCRQMLKIGTSKTGSIVDCPRCKKSVVVPLQSAPQAEQLHQLLKQKRSEKVTPQTADSASSEPAWEDLNGNIDDAELDRWIDELWTSIPTSKDDSAPARDLAQSRSLETDLAALQHRYKLTVTLFNISLAVVFLAGVLSGVLLHLSLTRSANRASVPAVNQEAASKNEVSGTLYYLNENGDRQADADAVIICLPKDKPLPQPLSFRGLRPDEEQNNDSIQLIAEMGGMYARADANGSFTLPYQEGIRYYVVLISAHVQGDEEVSPTILRDLRRFFRDPNLLNNHCLITDEWEWADGKLSPRFIFEPNKK
jgi:hypothetical protein